MIQIVEPIQLKEVAHYLFDQKHIAFRVAPILKNNYKLPVHKNDTGKVVMVTQLANARHMEVDPEIATMITLYNAVLRLIAKGGEILSLSFTIAANRKDPNSNNQTNKCFKAINEFAQKFGIQIIDSDLKSLGYSLAQENFNIPILTITVTGFLTHEGIGEEFKKTSDKIYLIGYSKEDLSGSEYLYGWHKYYNKKMPYFQKNEAYNLYHLLKGIVKEKLVQSVECIGEGGLFVALANSAMSGSLGFKITTDFRYRKDAWLFGEKQSRVLVSVSAENEKAFLAYLKNTRNLLSREENMGVEIIGTVIDEKMVVDNELFFNTYELIQRINQQAYQLLPSK